ncbi:MAG: DUF445 family protein [Bacteroidota bacterium]
MLYVVPFISAAIGWITNYIAIKMLFYPREEVNLVLFRLQGIFPKRQSVLAAKLARIVAYELFTIDSLRAKIETEETKTEAREMIQEKIESYMKTFLTEKIPFLAGFLDEKRMEQIREKIGAEIDKVLPTMIAKLSSKLDAAHIEEVVYEKVSTFSSEKLEGLLMSVLKKELKFIELAGAILGFVIGLIQLVIVKELS